MARTSNLYLLKTNSLQNAYISHQLCLGHCFMELEGQGKFSSCAKKAMSGSWVSMDGVDLVCLSKGGLRSGGSG